MKRISKFIVPFALFILWGYLTVLYIFNYNLSLSVISYPHSKNNFVNFSANKLFAGQKIVGSFKADENYLGIVTVSFATFGTKPAYLDEDTLVFRIKQLGARDWLYEQTYKGGLMYEVPLYPFGFPKIADSRGKNYLFEIESLSGNEQNAVALNGWEPVLVARYQLPKAELLQNKTKLAEFFGRKLLVAFGSRDVQFFSFVYFLPVLLYILMFVYPFKRIFIPAMGLVFKWLFWLVEISLGKLFKKIIKQLIRLSFFRRFMQTLVYAKLNRMFKLLIHSLNCFGCWGVSLSQFSMKHLDFILVMVIIVDIFLIPVVNDIAFIVVIVSWAMLAKRLKYVSGKSFVVGFIFLALCPLILLFKLDNIAEKSGAWAYLFFVVGVIQILKENRGSISHEEN